MKNYFFCLLPQENSSLYSKVKSLSTLIDSPQIKRPLHLTIYFLSQLNESQIMKSQQWLDNTAESLLERITAEIGTLSSFSKAGKEFVFSLPIKSDFIQKFNIKLFNHFQDFHKDEFSFVPHISLFYPKATLSEQNKNTLRKHFQDVKQITFDQLALASEEKGEIKLEKVINLL